MEHQKSYSPSRHRTRSWVDDTDRGSGSPALEEPAEAVNQLGSIHSMPSSPGAPPDNHVDSTWRRGRDSRGIQQPRQTGLEPRRRKNKVKSIKRHERLPEQTPLAEERGKNNSSSPPEYDILQDPLTKRIHLTQQSYTDFVFDIELVFRNEFPDFERYGISLAKSARLTTLNEGNVAKLEVRTKAIKEHLRRFADEERMDHEVNLVRSLLKRKELHPGYIDPVAVSVTIYQQRKNCKNIINLHDFEMYSSMIILRATNRQGVGLPCQIKLRYNALTTTVVRSFEE